MNLIQEYIKQTPMQLNKIIEGSKNLFSNVSKLGVEKIIITGSGTSYHSGAQMQQIMRVKSGIEVNSYYPFQVTKELFNKNYKKTLFIGISQGGSSFSTFDAMKIAKENGCIISTMAGEKNAYIDQLADEILTVNIGEEKAGAKTKGYYATKLNLLLLAEYIGLENGTLSEKEFNDDINDVKSTLGLFSTAYNRALGWVEQNKESLANADNIRIVGPSDAYGDTLEGALKILETCRIPVTGYEFNEFIHGIYNAIDEKSTVIFIDDGNEPRLNKMLEVLGQWSNELYVIDFSNNKDSHRVGYGIEVKDELKTFIFPLACQIMASILPELKNIDPSTPKDTKFHMELGSKKFNH
jgi:glucoselysine-6-phosphate deglycase